VGDSSSYESSSRRIGIRGTEIKVKIVFDSVQCVQRGRRLTQYEALRHLEHRFRFPVFEHFAQDSEFDGMLLRIGE
jgi:hypothetical protein